MAALPGLSAAGDLDFASTAQSGTGRFDLSGEFAVGGLNFGASPVASQLPLAVVVIAAIVGVIIFTRGRR